MELFNVIVSVCNPSNRFGSSEQLDWEICSGLTESWCPYLAEKCYFYKKKDSANKIRLKTCSMCQPMCATCWEYKKDWFCCAPFLRTPSELGDRVSQRWQLVSKCGFPNESPLYLQHGFHPVWDTLPPLRHSISELRWSWQEWYGSNQTILYVLHVAHNGVHLEWIYDTESLAESFLL